MSLMGMDFEGATATSRGMADVVKEIEDIRESVGQIKLAGSLDASYTAAYDKSIQEVSRRIEEDAKKLSLLVSTLDDVIELHENAERRIMSLQPDAGLTDGSAQLSAESRADKRNPFQKFIDWLFRKTPEDIEEDAIRSDLKDALRNEKYSKANWEKSNVEERKRILQDYANEAIAVYGLQEVVSTIKWDGGATYTPQSITWGYYSDDDHTITLNERALTDTFSNCDSYQLLDTVNHEFRHAYQHEAVEHPEDFEVSQDTIEEWKDNFVPGHYIQPDGNSDGSVTPAEQKAYEDQPIEKDAREFEVIPDGFLF